jgi:hypothetical protein
MMVIDPEALPGHHHKGLLAIRRTGPAAKTGSWSLTTTPTTTAWRPIVVATGVKH